MLIWVVYCHAGCIHDQIIKNKKLIPINDTATSRRLLQNLPFGPIRFHLVYNTTQVDTSTTLGQNIITMMGILQLFWQKTIEVWYQPSLSFNLASGIDRNYVTCLTYVVPQDIINNPTPDKDYGIFVAASNDGSNGITAYSYPCAYSMTTNQPTWGLLSWNTNYFNFDLLSFQMNLKIGIHESTHLLGFSNILFSNYLNGKFVTNSKGAFLNGTYIQKAIREQYGCSNASGMLLESGGGSGTSMSHWSYKAAYNEFMTAGVLISNPTISYLTLALLEETGWYKSIFKGFGQFLNWGYRKGCAMLDASNCNSDEYCTSEGTKACDYDGTSLGFCKNETLTSCLFVKFYVNYICTDPNFLTKNLNANISGMTGESGGQFSRCFSSNLVVNGAEQTKHPFRCYKTMCSISGRTLTIQVGNTFALCLFPSQNITVPGYSGYLTCPKSFQRICAIKRCPKECNGNGVCLNGRCLCSPNYTG